MRNSYKQLLGALVLVGSVGLGAVTADAADISGAGATFPYPVYAKWAEAYRAKSGVAMNYQSIGSGAGIKQIKAKTVDFGATDLPLDPADLEASGLAQWPQIIGGIVPVINVKGVKPGQLKLSGKVLGDIFLGNITNWNDKAIAELNAGLALPDEAIAVVHRSDGSGTTYNFAYYLAAVNAEWKEKVGVNAALEWPTGLGGKGNEGVAALSSRTEGAIGYVEYAYAKQTKLTYALVQNKEGQFPEPNAESFAAAAANADWAHAPGFKLLIANQPGPKSWPISASSFILAYKVQAAPEKGKAVLDFFDWSFRNGQAMADALDYVPIPENVVKLIEDTWSQQIKGADGKPVWTGPTS